MNYTPEQIKENRAKWVKLLRSGKYKQGQQVLFNRKEKSYCCLGVLCVAAGIKPVKTKTANGTFEVFGDAYNVAPKEAMEFVGLDTEGGAFEDYNRKYSDDLTNALWKMNDFTKLSFDKIADVIEAEPKGLFK